MTPPYRPLDARGHADLPLRVDMPPRGAASDMRRVGNFRPVHAVQPRSAA